MASAAEYESYIQTKLSPILESLVTEVLLAHPEDPILFMIQKLCQRAQIPDPTAAPSRESQALKEELWRLREEVKQAVQQQQKQHPPQHPQNTGSEKDEDEEDEDDDEEEDEEEIENKLNKMRGFNKMRQSVCAEVYGQWNKKKAFTPPVHPKSDEQTAKLQGILSGSFLFNCLDEKDMHVVVAAMKSRSIPAEMTLIKQGDDGECLFVVEEGKLQCWVNIPVPGHDPNDGDQPSQPKMVKEVGPGDVFGELALLYNAPRAATVKSVTPCTVWRLDRDTFNAIVKDSATKKRDMYDEFLKKVRLLQSMSAYDRLKLADALRPETYKEGECIVKQGEFGDTFYLIEEGTAEAWKSYGNDKEPVLVDTLEVGDYFGELALLTGEPRAASVIAKEGCKVAALERKSFKRLLGSVEEIMRKKAEDYKKAPGSQD